MRLLPILTCLLLISPVLRGQALPEPSTYIGDPPSPLILQWLHSPDPRLQTWAAHDVLVVRATDLIPELQAQLDRIASGKASGSARPEKVGPIFALLDTLIQLEATVPAETLTRLCKLDFATHVEELVLLSRLPWNESEPAIGSFYRPTSDTGLSETRVAAQLLVHHPPAGFPAELLASISVNATIFVHDPSSSDGYGFGFSSCCGAVMGSLDMSWPEIGRYAFLDPPRDHQPPPESDTLFLSAPDPVYLRRIVSRDYYAHPCGGFASLNDAIRSHLVGTLLGGNPASPLPEQHLNVAIPFTSRESYGAQVQSFVDEQQANFAHVASALTTLNLLTEEERQAAALRVNLSLQDTRTQPAPDLPILTFRPPVQWVSYP